MKTQATSKGGTKTARNAEKAAPDELADALMEAFAGAPTIEVDPRDGSFELDLASAREAAEFVAKVKNSSKIMKFVHFEVNGAHIRATLSPMIRKMARNNPERITKLMDFLPVRLKQ